MQTSAPLNPEHMRHAGADRRVLNWRWPVLAVAPLGLGLLAMYLRRAAGPPWMGPGYDPEYAYLLNALNIALGKAAHLVTHPGTPVQTLGAGILHIVYRSTGSESSLALDVLERPGAYLASMHALLLALIITGILLVGRAAYLFTGSLLCAVVTQASVALSLALIQSTTRVSPEPFVLALSLFMTALVLRTLSDEADHGGLPRRALLLGACAGLVIATRITAFPVFLVALASARGTRNRVLASVGAMSALLIALAPLYPRWGALVDWCIGVALGAGRRGAGPRTIVDSTRFMNDLSLTARAEPAVFASFALGLATVVATTALLRRERPQHLVRQRNVLAGVVLTQFLMILMVAKHPGPHYLVPAAALIPLSLCLVWSLCGIGRGRLVPALRGLLILAAAGMLTVTIPQMRAWNGHLTANREAQLRMHALTLDLLEREPHAWLALGGAAAHPSLGMAFGNFWAGGGYSEVLEERFPRILHYNSGADVYRSWSRALRPHEVAHLRAEGPLYVQMPARLVRPEMRFELVAQDGRLGLFRALAE